MSLPPIAICVPEFNRPDIIVRNINGLIDNLWYSGPINIIVSIDGEFEDTAAKLQEVHDHMESFKMGNDNEWSLQWLKGPGTGHLGNNLNFLLDKAKDYELVMMMDDDHVLTQPLSLDSHAKLLMECDQAGWVRLYGIGHHAYVGELKTTRGLVGRYWWIRWNSPSLYITSFRPHLKHGRFHEHFGRYPEGLKLAATEEGFCHQVKNKAKKVGGPQVLVPIDDDMKFKHVGKSWQAKGF